MANYVKSEIKSLPNFNCSIEHQGSLNSVEYIHWFKLDEDGNYLGLTLNEALDLANILNKQCSVNVIKSSVEAIEEDEIPYVVFSPNRILPVDYELSKILNYEGIFDFEILGYLPSNHHPL